MPLRKLGKVEHSSVVHGSYWGVHPEALWAGKAPALCWEYLTQWGALGSGTQCHLSTKINLLTTSSYRTWSPPRSLALHINARQSFQNRGQSTAPKRLGQLQGGNTFLEEGNKKKKEKEVESQHTSILWMICATQHFKKILIYVLFSWLMSASRTWF